MRAVFAVCLAIGCYSPTPPTGAPCVNGQCPAGLVCSPATQTCEHVAQDGSVGDDGPRDAASDARVDAPGDAAPSFLYRRRITIHNLASTALPAGFTIRVVLGQTLGSLVQSGKVQGDYSDLRVIGGGAIGERDRIVDPSGGPAPAAVSFALAKSISAGATSNEYALYYGKPSAGTAPANGTAVFTIYDDFTNGISNVWLTNDGPVTSAGQLVLRGGHLDALTTNAASDGLPIVSAVEVVASVVDPNSNPTTVTEGTLYYWFGYQHTGDFSATDPWAVWIARGKGAILTEQKSPVGCEMGCTGSSVVQNTAAHYYAVERDPTVTRFSRDGASPTSITVMNTEDYSVLVRNYLATSDVRIDYIRARARVTPDPDVTFGAEENL